MSPPPVHTVTAAGRAIALAVAASIAMLPGAALAQDPEHEGEIEGVVRDAATGNPLAGATVSVVGSGIRAVTHGDGAFHLTGIEEGNYRLRVERLGYQGTTIETTVVDESAVVEIELVASPIAVQGMVVTATLSERRAAETLRPVGVMAGDELHSRHRPHRLSGQWSQFWECHIEPDWLLIWDRQGDAVVLVRTGTHSDLFG